MALHATIENLLRPAYRSGNGRSDVSKREKHQPFAQGDRVVAASAGGVFLAASVMTRSWRRALLAVAGATLAYRGISGDRRIDRLLGIGGERTAHPEVGVRAGRGFRYQTALTIQASPEQVYSRWSDFEKLPEIFKHVNSVTKISDRIYHWVAEGPFGKSIEWDAEIHNERENELIAWQSLPGSTMDTAGSVHFERALGDRGTVLRVSLKYDPPAGKLGVAIAKLFGTDLTKDVSEDLRRFKQAMETGEVATIVGQTRGSCMR